MAVNGDDGNSGTIDAPFATQVHARDVARETQGANIYWRSGTFARPTPLSDMGERLFSCHGLTVSVL